MICLVGFMGAGKSSALVELAAHGLSTADIDRLVETSEGLPVAEIFSTRGEEAFRAAEEREILAALGTGELDAIALGGGSLGSEAVREALSSSDHTVVWIDVDSETAWRRVRASTRPLAQDRDAFEALHAERQASYRAVADVVLPAVTHRVWDRALSSVRLLDRLPEGTRMLWASSRNGEYPVFVGRGLLGSPVFDQEAGVMPGDGRSFLFTDEDVGPIYGAGVGETEASVTVPPGEGAKTMAEFERSQRELTRLGMTRSDRLIALGGGVVGDLAGFCAHTYQRGVPVVQVPTTLVSQVDSSYGGKTGVDLPEGKNYVGAFHLPSAVIADVDTLATLPDVELTAGLAEVVKTALLAGGQLWEEVRNLEPGEILGRSDLIFDCARYKCRVVEADERDTGLRAVLNLGHTVGHAIEAVTGYGRYRHGEAIALGLLAALRLSDADELRAEVHDWQERHGLPVRLDPAVNIEAVLLATGFDKKKTARGVGFVLLPEPGQPEFDCPVPDDRLRAAVEELIR